MKFNKILLIGFSKEDLGKNEWDRLNRLCSKIVLLPKGDPEIKQQLKTADCLLVKLGATVDKKMIDSAPKLKYIGMSGTGYGRIDISYAAFKKISVCNIAGYSTEAVAELGFGLILEHIREIAKAKKEGLKGNYSEVGFQGYEIKDKNFGVIGLGRIGRRIAEIAQGFGANVWYWSRNRKNNVEKKGVEYKKIDDLLKKSDFISLNLAYTPDTKNFIDKKKIQHIKPKAVVINLSPMELIDIQDLEKRLEKKDITFIIDHADELSSSDVKRLSKYKDCIMYPPIGFVTHEATRAKLKLFVDNIENYLKGKPTNKVN